jgi:hypothetical protein
VGKKFEEMLNCYGINSKPTTVKNPMADAIIEQSHGKLGEQLQATIFDNDWSKDGNTLIQAFAYAMRIMELAFGYDLIFC